MSTVIDVSNVSGKPMYTFAKMHNDGKRELFMPFVVFSYPKWATFESVKQGLNIACSSLLKGQELEILKANGTWKGEQEDSCVVFYNSASLLVSILDAAFTHYHQQAVLSISMNRQASIYTGCPYKGSPVFAQSTYMGIWESQGNKRPEGEDYTEVGGVYYTIRKRKGE